MAKKRLHPVTFQFPEFGICIFTSRHGQGFHMPPHHSNYHELVLVHQGHGQLNGWGNTITLKPNDLIHIPPQQKHRFVDFPGDPLTLTNLCFKVDIFQQDYQAGQLYHHFMNGFPTLQPVALLNMFRQNRVAHLFQEILQEQTLQKQGHSFLIRSLLDQLLVFLFRISDKNRPKQKSRTHHYAVTACLEYMEAHFSQSITIAQLTQLTDYTERRLSTLFKQETGQTMHQYLTSLRVDYAKKRLRETNNIIQTAFEAGFNDLTTFYRSFKKQTGKTPKTYLT